jgi:hypothetical protein
MTNMTASTILVRFQVSWGVGQFTLRSSPMVSLKNREKRFDFALSVTAISSFLRSKRRHWSTALSYLSQAGQAGIEPTTSAFGERRSTKLSYWPVIVNDADPLVYTINDGVLFISSRDAMYVSCSAGSTC